MRSILYILILISFVANTQNLVVECGAQNRIQSGQIMTIDTLKFTCAKTLLIQDNAVLYLKHVEGTGQIKRGGKGGAPTVNGIDRYPGDESPMVVLIGCVGAFVNLEILENIDKVLITDNCDE